MKSVLTLMVGIIAIIPGFTRAIPPDPGNTTLSGRILDKESNEPIPGVTIYLPDLKTGTTTDTAGNYRLENLPQARVLVQVTMIGYKFIAEYIDLAVTNSKNFSLEESVAELNEIVVTGLSKAAERNRTPTPITTVPHTQLLENSSTNIIDALAQQPGISQVTSGSGISKPVIRGLGYNRVVTVNDGIRQEGQQWGDEHGIEIDEFSVNKAEILKGPASLAFGSDAMAGVINMISAPTLPAGKMVANFLGNYQTNNGLTGYSVNFAGNQKGFIWDTRYSNKLAHAYQNKVDGDVFNSGFRENTISGIAGYNRSWGYSHLHFSAYYFTPGIIEGERDSATGMFTKPFAKNDTTEGFELATKDDFNSYTPLTPYQKIHHYKAVLNNSFALGQSTLKAILGYQQNQRQEYSDVLRPGEYGLYFLLNSFTYDLQYNFPDKNNFSFTVGVNGMHQSSENKGTEFLIPGYKLFDMGIFAFVKKTIKQLDLSGGLRFDSRNETGEELFLNQNGEPVSANEPGASRRFTSFNSTFNGVSGSVGATYQFSDLVFNKLNLSRGFRTPNIAELSANGVHEGTINYIIGDPKLKSETSLQLDYAFGINSAHVTAEADLFSNQIDNYIFLGKLQSVSGEDSITDGYSTFKYSSGDADVTGGEISIDIHPHPFDWLHFENAFSYVLSTQKNQPDSMKYLPFTPAPKFTSELKASVKKLGKNLTNAYVQTGIDVYFKQDKIYSASGTETPTPGYQLINFGFGSDIISKGKTLFSIYISASNLTDVAYQSHLSRLKYADVNNVTGRTGVYNMGRNISFKLVVPVDFHKKTAS